jgi:AraC family transcriptional regulator
MSKVHRVHHGTFGHVCVLELTGELVTHAHSSANVSFWLGGSATQVSINGVPVGHDAESAAIIDCFVPHRVMVADCATPAQTLSFYLEPEWLAQVMPAHLPGSFSHLDTEISPLLRDELWALRDMLLADSIDEIELDCALVAFLKRALMSSRNAETEDARGAHKVRDFRLRKALALMRENVARDLDMETVARMSGLSRAHFFSMFRDELELTPAIFWNSLRLEEAMLQMRSSPESLTSVASTLGFTAQCNFTRFFRQRTGVVPSEYRQALRRKRRSRSTLTMSNASLVPEPDITSEQDLEPGGPLIGGSADTIEPARCF